MFERKDEILQDLSGIHARSGAEEAPRRWIQEAQKDHENMSTIFSVPYNLP